MRTRQRPEHTDKLQEICSQALPLLRQIHPNIQTKRLMLAITVLSTGALLFGLLALMVVMMRRQNKQHIENVATGRARPDLWFWKLLDDPEYLDYCELCLGLAKIARVPPRHTVPTGSTIPSGRGSSDGAINQ